MNYVVKFEFSNKNLSKLHEYLLKKEFVKRRDFAVKIMNPMLASWNEDFIESHPELDGTDVDYLMFMKARYDVVLSAVNKESIGCNLIELDIDDDEFDIFGYSEKFKTRINLYIVEE